MSATSVPKGPPFVQTRDRVAVDGYLRVVIVIEGDPQMCVGSYLNSKRRSAYNAKRLLSSEEQSVASVSDVWTSDKVQELRARGRIVVEGSQHR